MEDNPGNLTTDELGRLFPVVIAEYSPEWKKLFIAEKEKIIKACAPGVILSVEHIGSTAIPGLCAKPTIDILLEIAENADPGELVSALESIGYQTIKKPENPPPHLMLAKGYSISGYTGQTFHIHIRHPGYRDEIVFRDYLLSHPEVSAEYGSLKRKLADEFPNDREKYTEGKSEFVRNITDLAGKKR